MINIQELLKFKKVEVKYLNPSVEGLFIKEFRQKHKLTQTALANIMGVTKKAIEKWEQGANKVKGSAAILIQLLDEHEELIDEIRQVSVIDENGERTELVNIKDKEVIAKSLFGVIPNDANLEEEKQKRKSRI